MASILIVDDDIAINDMIRRNLTMVGYICDQAMDGKEALQKLDSNKYDLILLDIMLPYLSGFEIIQKITTPTIFLTAKDSMDDKLKGLTSGAEDYIIKPFEMLELIARINIVLRRTNHLQEKITIDDVEIDLGAKVVTKQKKPVDLTPQEYNLLEVLVLNKNLALSRDKLLNQAWGYDFVGDTKTVDVHIQKIRKKLSFDDRIKTIYKLGYRLEV